MVWDEMRIDWVCFWTNYLHIVVVLFGKNWCDIITISFQGVYSVVVCFSLHFSFSLLISSNRVYFLTKHDLPR